MKDEDPICAPIQDLGGTRRVCISRLVAAPLGESSVGCSSLSGHF